jgi:hypothetical protein
VFTPGLRVITAKRLAGIGERYDASEAAGCLRATGTETEHNDLDILSKLIAALAALVGALASEAGGGHAIGWW